jgi:hypothetical protein
MTFVNALKIVETMNHDQQKRVLDTFCHIAAAFADIRVAFTACVDDELFRQHSEAQKDASHD